MKQDLVSPESILSKIGAFIFNVTRGIIVMTRCFYGAILGGLKTAQKVRLGDERHYNFPANG
jgi:hypothetical protein